MINHSGGAYGSDYQWDTLGKPYKVVSVHYYYKEKTPYGNKEINKKKYLEGLEMYYKSLRTLGRYPSKKQFVLNLVSRNWQQVKNSEAIFAVAELEERNRYKTVSGGTGYAVEYAKLVHKPIFVFVQNYNSWVTWDYNRNKFNILEDIPVLTENFAGIGTRNINKFGIQAIKDVYSKTFGGKII